jgi:hypothetical protein
VRRQDGERGARAPSACRPRGKQRSTADHALAERIPYRAASRLAAARAVREDGSMHRRIALHALLIVLAASCAGPSRPSKAPRPAPLDASVPEAAGFEGDARG